MHKTSVNYIGIDVSKAHLDFAGEPSKPQRIPNTSTAIRKHLQDLPPDSHLLVEATGGYERLVVAAAHAAARPVSVLHPARVRRSGEARGRLAKTDPLDAALTPRDLPGQLLAELVTAREQLVARKVELASHLEHAPAKVVSRLLRSQLRQIGRHLLVLETEIRTLLGSKELQARADLRLAQPGIGPVIAATLLAHLPKARSGQLRADRRPGRPRSLQSRQRPEHRPSPYRRRTASGPPGPLPRRPEPHPDRIAPGRLLQTSARLRQTRQSRPHRHRSQTPHFPQLFLPKPLPHPCLNKTQLLQDAEAHLLWLADVSVRVLRVASSKNDTEEQ